MSGLHSVEERRALRAIASFEAIKGVVALAALIGVFDLMHRDVRHLAIDLIGRFHLNPEARYPSTLLHYADLLPDANVRLLMVLAVAYVASRLLESYGLWNDRAWGGWLGALSGGIYIPFEVRHILHRPSVTSAVVLAANVCVVGFLAFWLWRKADNVRARR